MPCLGFSKGMVGMDGNGVYPPPLRKVSCWRNFPSTRLPLSSASWIQPLQFYMTTLDSTVNVLLRTPFYQQREGDGLRLCCLGFGWRRQFQIGFGRRVGETDCGLYIWSCCIIGPVLGYEQGSVWEWDKRDDFEVEQVPWHRGR
jgi:hypothetical protein